MSRALTAGLALLLPPVLVLASAHELYLRNQEELARTISVLYPFWGVAAAAVLLAAGLRWAAGHRAARVGLTAYYAAGLGFMGWSFLRALPAGAHLLRWLLDSAMGAAVFAVALVGLTVLLARRVDPRDLEPAFAVLAAILIAREAVVLGAGLDRNPPPPPRDVVGELGPGADPGLPNVYHLILDSFQGELFEARLGPEEAEALDGFVRFRATSRSFATSQALPAILAGRWLEGGTTRRARTGLAGEESLLTVLRHSGYRTIAFVPRYLYENEPGAVDVMVFHRLNVPEPDARALHAAAFLRLWLFRALPLAASERLARGEILGFGAEFFEMKGVERVATFHKPLLSRLSLEGLMAMEPRLPPRGRYTLVHLALPHVPYRLRADCSDASGETDLVQQTDCTLLLLRRFVDLLRRLDRLDDSIILVHGDHGSGLVLKDGRLVEDESAWYRTLLLIKPAGARKPLRLSEEPARLEDIAPTLLALLGIDPGFAYEGRVLDRGEAPGEAPSKPPGGEPGLTATGSVGTMPNTRGP
jgi:hypothetical protein